MFLIYKASFDFLLWQDSLAQDVCRELQDLTKNVDWSDTMGNVGRGSGLSPLISPRFL